MAKDEIKKEYDVPNNRIRFHDEKGEYTELNSEENGTRYAVMDTAKGKLLVRKLPSGEVAISLDRDGNNTMETELFTRGGVVAVTSDALNKNALPKGIADPNAATQLRTLVSTSFGELPGGFSPLKDGKLTPEIIEQLNRPTISRLHKSDAENMASVLINVLNQIDPPLDTPAQPAGVKPITR
ncbi:MAG: hypothetical protein K2X09_04430 [Rickettsiales bacterium]|nr:hypothetical protein [Rickettsiales bacterium]